MVEDRSSQIQTLYYQGKGQREIAREIGISQPAVRKHLVRLGILGKGQDEDKGSGVDMVFTLKDGNCIVITMWERAFYDVDNYIARCRSCHGFFVTRRRGQIYCCNSCAAGKPCSCGTAERVSVVIK
jgi:hypothetical protein